jgi:hypothetical protein
VRSTLPQARHAIPHYVTQRLDVTNNQLYAMITTFAQMIPALCPPRMPRVCLQLLLALKLTLAILRSVTRPTVIVTSPL